MFVKSCPSIHQSYVQAWHQPKHRQEWHPVSTIVDAAARRLSPVWTEQDEPALFQGEDRGCVIPLVKERRGKENVVTPPVGLFSFSNTDNRSVKIGWWRSCTFIRATWQRPWKTNFIGNTGNTIPTWCIYIHICVLLCYSTYIHTMSCLHERGTNEVQCGSNLGGRE